MVQLNPDREDAAEVAALDDDGETAWAELNYTSQAPEGRPRYFFTSGSHSAPLAADQPPPAELNLDAARCVTGDGVIVAVLDTGIDATHPALEGRVLAGSNVVTERAETADSGNGIDDDGDGEIDEMTGHGTHVAGIIAEVAPDA
ncbi:MAG: S8 family serine peptidase, partial [Chloroflexia bacterium]|nr:S8 family serine peptidase [Chloroflexia bacterium]